MIYLPDLDISRYLVSIRDLLQRPEIFSSIVPWFHFDLASTYQLSGAPSALFQTGVALLGLMSIPTFYMMARKYLVSIDNRAPIIATIFFAVFSGLGWMSYFGGFNVNSENVALSLLSNARLSSYWDVGYGQGLQIWLWFRDITVGLILLFTLLYMLTKYETNRIAYIIISSLLLVALSQVHFSELVIFITLLLSLAALFPSTKLRTKDMIYSSFISLGVIMLFNLFHVHVGVLDLRYQDSISGYTAVLLLMAFASLVLLRYPHRPRIPMKIDFRILVTVMLSVYSLGFLVWLSDQQNVISSFDEVYNVPWHFYPMLLGITGFIAIPASVHIIRKYRSNPVTIFLVMLLISLLVGKIISLINSDYFLTGYWERRIIIYDHAAIAILATVFVMDALNSSNVHKKLRLLPHQTIRIILVSLLILGGITSTLLSVDYNALLTKYTKVDKASIVDYSDPYTTVLTVTERSKATSEMSDAAYVINRYRIPVWSATGPEGPMQILSPLNATSVIYLDAHDETQIKTRYSDAYVTSHLVQNGRIYEDDKYKLIMLPRLSPPVPVSNTILVLPDDSTANNTNPSYFIYDVLSMGGYNYTTSLISDINTLREATTLIAPTEEIGAKLMANREKYALSFNRIMIFNMDGYNLLGNATDLSVEPIVSLEKNLQRLGSSASGSGNIGRPDLMENIVSNKTSLQIRVGDGQYGLWSVYRKFPEPINTSDYHSVRFNWFGNGDNLWYVVKVISSSNEYYWFRFQDSWVGWREVVIPFTMNDGYSVINSVKIQKVTLTNSPVNIDRIEIGTESANTNRDGDFYIEGFRLEGRKAISIRNAENNHVINFNTFLNLNYSPNYGDGVVYFDGNIPFISTLKSSNYDIYYINIKPITDSIVGSDLRSNSLFNNLGNTLQLMWQTPDVYEFHPTKQEGAAGPKGFFEKIIFSGKALIEGESILVESADDISVDSHDDHIFHNDIAKVEINSADKIVLHSDSGAIGQGTSFYSRMITNSSIIQISGNPAIVTITFEDDTSADILDSNITLSLNNSDLLIRNAKLSIDGQTKFDKIISYGDLRSAFGHDMRAIIIDGYVSGTLGSSDKFTELKDISTQGTIIRAPKFNEYDESKTWITILGDLASYRIVLLVIPIAIGAYLFSKSLIIYN